MSFLPALFPWQWWLIGAVPVGIVLLYFLKLRREPVEVPSTYLWARTVEDLHVNSLLQRLRRNLLLFLQLLAVLLAIFALLRPGIRGNMTDQDRYVYLLDTSASMSATDVEDAENRFEQARKLIRDRIDTLSDYDEAMLVSFSDRPIVLQAFTSDRGRLRDALKRAELTPHRTDVLGALKAADGLANPKRTSQAGDAQDVQVADEKPAALLIYSDGGFQTSTQRTIQVGERVNLETLARWMREVGYQDTADESVTLRTQMLTNADQLEFHPPASSDIVGAVRIQWKNQKISWIRTFDPEDGQYLKDNKGNIAEQQEISIVSLDTEETALSEFSLGNLTPKYIGIGSDNVSNLGIVAFNAERDYDRPGEIQAYATVVNLGSQPAQAAVSLYVGDTFYEASKVDLKPGEEVGLSFNLQQEEAVGLRLQLESTGNRKWNDDFELDDVSYAALSPLSNVSVLVITPGNNPLRLGLGTSSAGKICISDFKSPSFLESEDYKKRAASGVDDLIVYDRCSPKEMPATNTFFIGSLPAKGWKWSTEKGQLFLVDVDRTHPLMRYVALYSLLIFSGQAIEGPPGTTELVGADVGPVLSIAPRDGYQDLVLGFEVMSTDEDGSTLANTNWFAERSWPVFMFNILRYLAGAAQGSGAPTYRPGDTVRLRVENAADTVNISRQDDRPTKVQTGPSGSVEFVDTDAPGNYRVESDDRLLSMFSINLFDRRESDIAAAANIDLGYEEVENAASVERRREYWRLILLLMLALLGFEWWLYAKRVA